MKALNLTALQWDLFWHQPEANRKHAEKMLNRSKQKHDLIVLPEMFTTGFTMEPTGLGEPEEGPTYQWMHSIAKKYQALVMGSIIIKDHIDYYNRFLAVGPEGLVADYDKRHLFRMAGEHEVYEPGAAWVVFEYMGWKICPQICYDLRFPVWSRNQVDGSDQLRYDLMIYVANWPAMRVAHWETLLQARAIENQSYVVGVNRIGIDQNQLPYPGSSMIVDPKGNLLAHEKEQEAILQAKLDPESMMQYRQKFPAWQDSDTFDLYP